MSTMEEYRHRTPKMQMVRVSQDSREAAKPPEPKFADLDQEKQFWIEEKSRYERQLGQLKDKYVAKLSAASANSGSGAQWARNKAMVDSEFADERKALLELKVQAEEKVRDVRRRMMQKRLRDNPHAITPFDGAQAEKERRADDVRAIRLLLEALCQRFDCLPTKDTP